MASPGWAAPLAGSGCSRRGGWARVRLQPLPLQGALSARRLQRASPLPLLACSLPAAPGSRLLQVYGVPYLIVNFWLVTITMLQHTHPGEAAAAAGPPAARCEAAARRGSADCRHWRRHRRATCQHSLGI